MKLSSFLPLSCLALFQFCIPNKQLVYLQEKDNTTKIENYQTKNYQAKTADYKLQQGDILNIKVLSQDPLSVQPFNIDAQGPNSQLQLNIPQLFVSGYTVDPKGNIQFPLIGDIFVRDKTISEISNILLSKIEKYAINATVKVKLVSFKITVLGEVRNPSVVHIYNDRVTIFEVLGSAGDLTDLANRHKIKLIRTTGSNVQISNIDISDRSLVESNSYFLLPNDVIYVEPMKAKNFRLNLPTLNIIVTAITTLLVVYNILGK